MDNDVDNRREHEFQIIFMKTGKYKLIAVFGIIPLGGIAQIQIQTPIVKDTAKPAPVVEYALAPPAPDTGIRVYESAPVKCAVQRVYDYQRYSHGMSPGFRVQVDFGQDRNAINKVKSDFATQYPAMPCYISYQQPYFKMSVGDFRTKLDAVRFLNTVKKDYPAAFIVAEKIMPPPL